MNDDDDFGDLYAEDVGRGGTGTLYEASKDVGVERRRRFEDGDDEEQLLYGTSSSSAVVPAVAGGLMAGFEVGGKDVDNEETFLYGELYGSAVTTMSSKAEELQSASIEDFRGIETGSAAGLGNGHSGGIEAGANAGLGRVQQENAGSTSFENPRSVGESVVAPGLAPSGSTGLREAEDVAVGDRADESAPAAKVAVAGEGEDWDSDSDDGLQIVLNDDALGYDNPTIEAKSEFYVGSDDEDEEDLIIVAGDEPRDGQENWGEEGGLLSEPPLPGPPSGGPLGALERVTSGGDDRGPPVKPGGQGPNLAGPRIGYSGQGYYNGQPHHAQYKYVRPGSGASGAPASSQAGEPQPGERGAGRVDWIAGRGADGGKGDWAGRGRGGSNGQRGSQSGSASWGGSGGRGYSGGMEFTLPPTKTVFDIDLDELEEKPWQRPGADVTDYFNFGFTESSWKNYCLQLSQVRLEATMQSKIRVYESGRTEQEYDPDLPPELMAAQGLQDASGDNGNHQRQSDHGGHSACRGRGAGRGRPVMPTGRAIQVEGGGGERRPSADIRRQRTRDSDAVIQIVLQDASEDEPDPATGVDFDTEYTEDEAKGGRHMEQYSNYHHEEDVRDLGHGGPRPWMDYYPYNEPWDQGNMMDMSGEHMHGPMRHGVEGHGPIGPGMPMHPPGAGADFGMFPGPFGMAPYERGGAVRPPMYGGPRMGGGPMSGPGPDGYPSDHFTLQPPPVGFTEPQWRRTPPRLAHSNRAAPPGGEWEEELSNGSGANRSGHEHHSTHGNRDPGSLSREFDADTRLEPRSWSVLVEKGADEPSLGQVSGGYKRTKSKDGAEGEDSELGDKLRPVKRNKVASSTKRGGTSHLNSSGASSSDEISDSSLGNSNEPAPSRVKAVNVHEKVPTNNDASENHQYRDDSGTRRRVAENNEREGLHSSERSQGHRGKDEPAYDRRVREDRDRDRDRERERERREHDVVRHFRKDRGDERNDEVRKRGRPDYDGEREERGWRREQEEFGHRQRSADLRGQKAWVGKKKNEDRSRHGDKEKDLRPYDRDRERSRGREEARSHQRERRRPREEISKIDQEEERHRDRDRDRYRREDRPDRRDDACSRAVDRSEENRDRELRNRRHIEDRRKGEDRRNDLHRKSVVNGREAGDDARMQMRRRDGSEEREADVMRNDSLVKERSHHGCGELKRDKDNVRSGSHHDSESRRDKDGYHLSYQQDKEHGSEIVQYGDRGSTVSKRSQTISRRLENEDVSAHFIKESERESAVDEASSGEDDGQGRQDRSKIERWNSRKEREIPSTLAGDEKRHRRQSHAREADATNDARDVDQHTSENLQDQGRHQNPHRDVENNSRSEHRNRQQRSSTAKRYNNADAEAV
uniref:Pre-mRNA polyadenylation factor Fip1 domain-containing protein n=1 Tax=Physcomitrium patens TaxID=3218 RepID=A0A7I4A8T3_PHYPA